jgi:hypothetical protein
VLLVEYISGPMPTNFSHMDSPNVDSFERRKTQLQSSLRSQYVQGHGSNFSLTKYGSMGQFFRAAKFGQVGFAKLNFTPNLLAAMLLTSWLFTSANIPARRNLFLLELARWFKVFSC